MALRLLRRLRREEGFGLVELSIALVVLAVGLLVLVGAFGSGYVALNRASTVSAATALADKQMEAYRAQTYASLASSGTTTATQAGPDGLSYTVQSTFTTDTTTVPGRTLKVVTVSVSRGGKQWVQEQSTFDQLTGS